MTRDRLEAKGVETVVDELKAQTGGHFLQGIFLLHRQNSVGGRYHAESYQIRDKLLEKPDALLGCRHRRSIFWWLRSRIRPAQRRRSRLAKPFSYWETAVSCRSE
jgi:hypothetical protein